MSNKNITVVKDQYDTCKNLGHHVLASLCGDLDLKISRCRRLDLWAWMLGHQTWGALKSRANGDTRTIPFEIPDELIPLMARRFCELCKLDAGAIESVRWSLAAALRSYNEKLRDLYVLRKDSFGTYHLVETPQGYRLSINDEGLSDPKACQRLFAQHPEHLGYAEAHFRHMVKANPDKALKRLRRLVLKIDAWLRQETGSLSPVLGGYSTATIQELLRLLTLYGELLSRNGDAHGAAVAFQRVLTMQGQWQPGEQRGWVRAKLYRELFRQFDYEAIVRHPDARVATAETFRLWPPSEALCQAIYALALIKTDRFRLARNQLHWLAQHHGSLLIPLCQLDDVHFFEWLEAFDYQGGEHEFLRELAQGEAWDSLTESMVEEVIRVESRYDKSLRIMLQAARGEIDLDDQVSCSLGVDKHGFSGAFTCRNDIKESWLPMSDRMQGEEVMRGFVLHNR